jgi:phospho-N-acetylmuramoyl-pentapeptide-transferase
MRQVLLAASLGLIVTLFGTPVAIRLLIRRGYGQLIRDDGPTSHHTKRGTPTMGGAVIIIGTLIGYFGAHLITWRDTTVSGLLVLFLMTGLGIVGFLDDYIKVAKQRSLGLRAWAKLTGQMLIAVTFAILALHFPDPNGFTPASTEISFIRDTGVVLGSFLFVVWAYVMIAGTSNGVNLTDGLDGLATGTSVMVFASYVLIGIWQLTGRRVFRMAPLQHHFELVGWGEVTIVIRFWIIAGLLVALGLGVFYAEWVTGAGA